MLVMPMVVSAPMLTITLMIKEEGEIAKEEEEVAPLLPRLCHTVFHSVAGGATHSLHLTFSMSRNYSG